MRFLIPLLKLLPDKIYISIMYFKHFKKLPNLKNPVTFNEKLQWLKLHDHNNRYTQLVDKLKVRAFITDQIGEEFLIPLFNSWEDPSDINWETLPDEFVLKCNHDGGSRSVIICHDKLKIDKESVISQLKKNLKLNSFYYGREWPYKNVKPQVICEKLLKNENGEDLKDYKVFCFNGLPKLIQVDSARFIMHQRDFFDTEWNHINVKLTYPNSTESINKPDELEDILTLSKKLSKDLAFARIDLYIVNSKIYFGEITFFPGSGFERFIPKEFDSILGKDIIIKKNE